MNWRTEHFIGGRLIAGEGDVLDVENPATEEIIASISQVSPRQVDEAVKAAQRAFENGSWRDAGLRGKVIGRMADLLEERREEFKAALVNEAGTPVSISEFLQVQAPIEILRDLAKRAAVDRNRDLGVDERVPRSESVIQYVPTGVVAAIGAYNNPLLYLASKAVTAMAAGCTAVFTPSSLTPLTALLFGEIARDAGVPEGVLNIIAGEAEVARSLSLHPAVSKISMTGSVNVGRRVMQQAAEGIKGVVLELGGKSAGIILPGADLSQISLPVHGRYLRNAGQGCQSPTRLLVPEAMYDDFVDKSRETFKQIPIGDPWDPATQIGPLISQAHRSRVEGYVERALAGGGEILAGGGRPGFERGWYMNGALLGGLANDSEIATTELFGPVAVLIPYRDVDEAVAVANASAFGLAASIFGPLDEAKSVAARLNVGTVAINGGGNMRLDAVLGGWKQSGIGREWGEFGILEFLETRHVQWTI